MDNDWGWLGVVVVTGETEGASFSAFRKLRLCDVEVSVAVGAAVDTGWV